MSKKTTIIVASIFLILSIALYFIFLKPSKEYENTTALMAIPTNSPMVIVINKPAQTIEKLNDNELIKTLNTIPSVQNELDLISQFLDFTNNEDAYKFIKNKELYLSLNLSGRNNVNLLALTALRNSTDLKVLMGLLNQLKGKSEYTTRKYNKSTIHEFISKEESYYLAIHNGIVILSKKALLVEEAIRQSDTDLVTENPEIEPLLKTAGSQSDIQIYLNHKSVDNLFKKELSDNIKRKSALLKLYSGWTELDLSIKDQKILLSGFSSGKNENNFYGNAFLQQQPEHYSMDEILPQSTAFYLSLNLSDIQIFFNDYKTFLENRNLIFNRRTKLKTINDTYGKDIEQLFEEILDNEIAMAGIQVDQNNVKGGRVWIIETKSGTTALNEFLTIQKNYIKNHESNETSWQKEYEIDNETSFTIYKFPFSKLPENLFGEIFKEMPANWFTIYDNHLIFGDSFRSVSKAVHANILGETLASSMEYDRFKSNLNSRSNINFYSNIASCLPISSLFFNEEIANQLASNEDLRKFKAFAWQVSSSSEMLYNNACIEYNAIVKSKPQTIWQSHIEESFDCKPTFVKNHYDKDNKEIVLHDKANNFYLINNVGRVMWKIKLDAPILGEVHQIDYFQNGKYQYIFNTENKLYLIDRNGNTVKNFPINFRSKATNPVAIFDYDNNRNYRFFVACQDQKIYAYDKLGKLLKGWNLFKTDHLVTNALQHFRVDGKDYIVANDNMKDYILHRKGTIRVKTNNIYEHSTHNKIYLEKRTSSSEPRLVTTSNDGSLHYTYFDGRHEVKSVEKLSNQHYFEVGNLNQDEEYEYVFVDKNDLYIHNTQGKQILKKRFKKDISHQPHIYQFSNTLKKIGLTSKGENKIYLIDINGTPHPGFPLDGCTEFSIGFISNERSNFNLLVGSPDSYLYNYYVE